MPTYEYSLIYLAAPDDPRDNLVVSRSYQYPDPDTAMREAENNQAPERSAQWGTPSTKGLGAVHDWRFGFIKDGREYGAVVAVHPSGIAGHMVDRVWRDLICAEVDQRNAELRKRRTLLATAAPKRYLDKDGSMALINKRRIAQGKEPYTSEAWQEFWDTAHSPTREADRARANEAEQARLEELPPMTR